MARKAPTTAPARKTPASATKAPATPAKASTATTESARRRALFSFERISQPIATRRVFIGRMVTSIVIWFAIMIGGLAIGMAGYAGFEGMNVTDAYVNAAMILSGMGPVGELKTEAGKIFAGSYAIFSGLVIVIATGVVLAPIIHHVLHVFHADTDEKN